MLTDNTNIFTHIESESRRSAFEVHDVEQDGNDPSADLPVVAEAPNDRKPVQPSANRAFWLATALALSIWASLFATTLWGGFRHQTINTTGEWVTAGLLHFPYMLLLVFLLFGACERIGFYFRGRAPERAGRMPATRPHVCIQLPMFNEDAVAERVIEAAAAVRWPRDRLTIQVLDDSTDHMTRAMVELACVRIQRKTGVTIDFIHRTDRSGYKAGALEAGRHQTDAEFIAIFDADFLPPPDYLLRTVPHFYDMASRPLDKLALVQAQWGHLNDDESFLTAAQALWVDDHHTLQQSWRSAAIKFVNFTGTAGIWRASAIEAAGGWRSASLVEDCELSIRALFAGYRTKFVKEVVAPAELPQTFAAYRLQQKRWTQGWAQLQRLHLAALLFRYPTPLWRKAYLTYFMCISWQWPLWFSWILLFPFAMANGLSLAAWGTEAALIGYALPPLAFALFAGFVATVETRHTYSGEAGASPKSVPRRLARIIPYLVINAGMLPHHFCAFCEGLFGPLHAEFERTPKTASVTTTSNAAHQIAPTAAAPPKRKAAKLPYMLTEAMLLVIQLGWFTLFLIEGSMLAAAGSAWLAMCITGVRLAPHISAFIIRNQGNGQ
jgi:cellulose synthase/poly-beta-1,6-N-acetylglucosamine synthase-like glycosyltransferase